MHGLNFKFSPLLTEPAVWQSTDGDTWGSFVWALPVSDTVGWAHSFNDHLGTGRHFSLQCVIAAGPHREGNGRTLCLDCSFSEFHLRIPAFWFPSKYLVYFHFYQKTPYCPKFSKTQPLPAKRHRTILSETKTISSHSKTLHKLLELLEYISPLILFIAESLTE